MNKIKILAVIWIIITIIFAILVINDTSEERPISDLEYYRNCMNRCDIMEEIIPGTLNYDNETHREHHRLCLNACFEQLLSQKNKVA